MPLVSGKLTSTFRVVERLDPEQMPAKPDSANRIDDAGTGTDCAPLPEAVTMLPNSCFRFMISTHSKLATSFRPPRWTPGDCKYKRLGASVVPRDRGNQQGTETSCFGYFI